MQIREWDAVVIGGGVAGLSAAQMLGRARRRTLVVDGGAPRNRFAAHMHGVLGQDGTDPADLLARGRDEVRAYGVEVESGDVVSVQGDGDRLVVERSDGTIDRARTIVAATGLRDELPAIPGLAEQWGTGVLHCPYCHGWEVAGLRIGVLATSPASLHQIELVRQWSDDVTAFTALAGTFEPDVIERLAARGIRIVDSPVAEVLADAGALTGMRTRDGQQFALDAVFTAPELRPLDGFLAPLDLTRSDAPGAPILVDERGTTSHPRVFAAGNIAAPYANVPLSMGAGSMAGAGANAALVADDAARAVATARRNAEWEERYAQKDAVWSGRVNATVAAVVSDLQPGTALEVGCGEGADAVWLASRGWTVTGVDVSATAVRRAEDAARTAGYGPERARFVARDAADGLPDGAFDLVVASFLHSWEPDFPRFDILRDAAAHVSPGGRLLMVSHAAPPPWVREMPPEAPPMHHPREEWELLALDPAQWTVELAELRTRAVHDPDGEHAEIDDGVLLLRRRP